MHEKHAENCSKTVGSTHVALTFLSVILVSATGVLPYFLNSLNREMSGGISLLLYLVDSIDQLPYIKVGVDIFSDSFAGVTEDSGNLDGVNLSFVKHCGTGMPCLVNVTLAELQCLHNGAQYVSL